MPRRNAPPEIVDRRRGMLIEAAGALIVARIAVRWVPFRRIAEAFAHPIRSRNVPATFAQETCKDVVWALRRARRYLPGDSVCFPRALAAAWMLRRRGVATDLYYGAKVSDSGVKTHVWLNSGEIKITGWAKSPEFHVLARYSNAPSVGASDLER